MAASPSSSSGADPPPETSEDAPLPAAPISIPAAPLSRSSTPPRSAAKPAPTARRDSPSTPAAPGPPSEAQSPLPSTSASSPDAFSPHVSPFRSSSLTSPLRRMSRPSRDSSAGSASPLPGSLPTPLPSTIAQYAVSPPANAPLSPPMPAAASAGGGVDGHEPGHPWDSAWPGSSTAVLSPSLRSRSRRSSSSSNRTASPIPPGRPSTPPVRVMSSPTLSARNASRSPDASVRSSRRSPLQHPIAVPVARRASSESGELSAIEALVRRTTSRRPRSGSGSSANSSNSASSGSSLEGAGRLPPAQATAFANLEGPPSSAYDPADIIYGSSPRQANAGYSAVPIHIPHHERAAAGHGHVYGPGHAAVSPGSSGNASSGLSPSSLTSGSDNRLSSSPVLLRSPASPGLSAARIYAASGGPPATLSSPRLAGMRVSTDAALGVFAGNNSPVAFPPGITDASALHPGSPSSSPSGTTAPGASGTMSADMSQSPPKKRSFIGMPPRSGYELSDDPDDVGSESDDSASVGSGRGSTGGNTDDEQDTSDADGESGGEDDGFDHPDDRERRQQHTLARVRAVMEDDDDPDGARIARRLQMCRHQYSDAEENDAAETDALADDQASAEQDYEDLERAYQRRSRRGSRAILQINPALLLNGDDAVDQADVEWTPEEDGHGGDMPSPPDAIDDADDDHDTEDDSGAQFDDDNLAPLERIFMYAKSDMTYHRVLAARCLYEWLFDIELPVAVECLLPLVNSLGTDELDVCTAFVPHLQLIMWYFFRNCPLVELEKDQQSPVETATAEGPDGETAPTLPCSPSVPASTRSPKTALRPRIHVGTFTPLLCALLLNQHSIVADAAQYVLKQFIARLHVGPPELALVPIRSATSQDGEEEELLPAYNSGGLTSGHKNCSHSDASDMVSNTAPDDADMVTSLLNREGLAVPAEPYAFGRAARQAIEEELIANVAFAIGRLHGDADASAVSEEHAGPLAQSWEMPRFDASGSSDVVSGEHAESPPPLPARPPEADPQDVNMSEQAKDEAEAMDIEAHQVEEQQAGPSKAHSDGLSSGLITSEDSSSLHDHVMDETESDRMSEVVIDTNTEATVGRMSSVSLLGALVSSRVFSLSTLETLILPEIERLRTDPAYFVRKEIALLVAAVAKALGEHAASKSECDEEGEESSEIERCQSHIEHVLLDTFDQLQCDSIWHVRQGICLAIPSVFAQVQDFGLRRTKVVESVRMLSRDVSRQVRSTVLEIMGELIYLFHDTPDGPPPELVRYFKGEPFDLEVPVPAAEGSPAEDDSMGMQGMDSAFNMDEGWDLNAAALSLERPLVCAFNFPAVVLTLGKATWPELRRMHAELAQDSNTKARRSLAASLHELAKIIDPEDTRRDLLPLFDMFVLWDDAEVRSAAIEHVDQLLIHAPPADAEAKLQLLKEAWTGVFSRDWRVRERLIELVPALAPKFLLSDEEGNLVALTQLALSDSVASVRTVGARAVPVLYDTFSQCDAVLADGFLGMISDMAESERYRHRLSFLWALQAMLQANLPKSALSSIFLPRLLRMGKEERVVDVRITLARVGALLCGPESSYYPTPEDRPEELMEFCQALAQDKSQQVRQVMALALPYQVGSSPMCSRHEVEEGEDYSACHTLVLGPADGGPHRPAALHSSDDDITQETGPSNFNQLSAEHLYGLDSFAGQDGDTVHVSLQDGPDSSSSAYQMWQTHDTAHDEESSPHDNPATAAIDTHVPSAPTSVSNIDDDWVSTMDVGGAEDSSADPDSPGAGHDGQQLS